MNESLRRALLRARLSEVDVAARLEVDPKTVRRWLEGRVPYLRHRWAIASMLGLDEIDLWPQVGRARQSGVEVRAIYPHYDDVPHEIWHTLLASADQKIDFLTEDDRFLTGDMRIVAILIDRARAGVKIRICIRDTNSSHLADSVTRKRLGGKPAHKASGWCTTLKSLATEVRLYRTDPNNLIYRADDECMIVQQAYGIPLGRSPVLHLSRARDGDLLSAHLEGFERIWADARPT